MALKSLLNSKLRLSQIGVARSAWFFSTSVSKTDNSQQQENDEIELNKPIAYLGSNAASWRAKSSRSGDYHEPVWYQTHVVLGSLAAFLIYFCILREENDVDEKFNKTLYDHIDGLEESQLILTYKYNKEHGLDNSQVVARLKELNIDVEAVVS